MTAFPAYPKQRPDLPPEYRAIYAQHYADNRAGRGGANSLAQRLEGWMHRKVAALARPGDDLLDFGAGNLNHFRYEHAFRTYDVVEPFRELLDDAPDLVRQVSRVYRFVHDIEGQQYDRVFSVAVLEHLEDLPRDVAQCARLLKPGGVFQAGIPCEGEPGWIGGIALIQLT